MTPPTANLAIASFSIQRPSKDKSLLPTCGSVGLQSGWKGSVHTICFYIAGTETEISTPFGHEGMLYLPSAPTHLFRP